MADKIPEIIGKYKIMGLVAKGGMGAVYKAVHPSLKRLVIIKKLTIRNNATVKERFKREAQILLDMQSPYIVHLFDYFVEGSSHYIVEEYVDGLSLAQLLEKQVSLGVELSLLVFLDACLALKFAHARGIVHRDIKPGNILISKRAEVKLADFGIASSESGDVLPLSNSSGEVTNLDNNLTQSGVTLGTPAYMSPEQITDSRSVDKRADIYSMGVMLYEMLTGTKPFPSNISMETLDKIKKGKYINPRKLDKSIPPILCRMIKKMLKAKPERRFQSIDSVIKIVKKFLSKYDTHTIRIALAQSIISKKQFTLPVFEKKNQKIKKIIFIASSILLFSILFIYSGKKGYIHKTILSPWYSAVVLKMDMPATTSIDSDLPVRSFFFIDDGDKIPEVNNSRRVFFETNEKKLGVKEYSTYPVYLKDGKYRVKIAVGPYIMWRSLYVNGKDVNIKVDGLHDWKRNIKVHLNSYDILTGKDLSELTKFYLSYKGRWVLFDEIPLEDLKSGGVWRFMAKSEGFKDAVYSLILDWYQDELFLSIGLEPIIKIQ
ncbi:MAG: serine/threonine protein kinase [Treponema sp.]|nr:serine/threonine protein kinase [Treponema sp.]